MTTGATTDHDLLLCNVWQVHGFVHLRAAEEESAGNHIKLISAALASQLSKVRLRLSNAQSFSV